MVAGALVLLAFSVAGPALAQSDETVPEPDVTTIDGATTSILATTTTKPPECKELVPASAVFVGTVIGVTGDTARYAVAQVRSGELPATRVQVDYPDDIRFIKEGRQYVVGAVLVPATSRYQSKVRPPRDVPTDDPCNARDQVYTKNLDGSRRRHQHLLRAVGQGLGDGLGLPAPDAHRARCAHRARAVQTSRGGGVPADVAASRRATSATASARSGTSTSSAGLDADAEQNTSTARRTGSPVTCSTPRA